MSRPECGESGDLIEVALPGARFLEEFEKLRQAMKGVQAARTQKSKERVTDYRSQSADLW